MYRTRKRGFAQFRLNTFMTWYYKGKEFTEKDIDNNKGFIYEITEISTGRKYIGQKVFFNKVAKKPLKGKTRRRISQKQSDWLEYFGSNEELKQKVNGDTVNDYHREILRLCEAKSEMNYWEAFEIFTRHALLKDEYFNSWVSTRINKNQLLKMKI